MRLRTLPLRTLVSVILEALIRHRLLGLCRWQTLLVREPRKLALCTILGCISAGATVSAKLRLLVRLMVTASTVTRTWVIRLCRKQKWELLIPMLWCTLTLVMLVLRARRLPGLKFLVVKLWTRLIPPMIMQLLLLFLGVLGLITPESPYTVAAHLLVVELVPVPHLVIARDSLPALVTSPVPLLVGVEVIPPLTLPRRV